MPQSVARWLTGFIAGFLATLVFHQAVIGLLWLAHVIPRTPWSMSPVPPLGVPAVLSLAFWGGVWGIALVACLDRLRIRQALVFSLVFGALLPPLVSWFVVSPIKGRPLPSTTQAIVIGMLVNAAWGVGTWLIVKAIARSRR